jgi:hypothetical protein
MRSINIHQFTMTQETVIDECLDSNASVAHIGLNQKFSAHSFAPLCLSIVGQSHGRLGTSERQTDEPIVDPDFDMFIRGNLEAI